MTNSNHFLHNIYAFKKNTLKETDYIDLIKRAFAEDKVENDVTTLSIFDKPMEKQCSLISRASGILAGLEVARKAFCFIDPSLKLHSQQRDGIFFTQGETLLTVTGNIQSILRAERIALNFLSMLSSIATETKEFVSEAKKYNVQVLDTRKTLPGYRALSKYAVAMGGGLNHREDLECMGMLKDNHIAACGSITNAIKKFKERNPLTPVEIEIDSINQLHEALEARPQVILLDNMSNQELTTCARQIQEFNQKNETRILSEASGGFTLSNLHRLKDTGVDFVSIGALTSHIVPLDIGLDIKPI